jgi:hypothetical protein
MGPLAYIKCLSVEERRKKPNICWLFGLKDGLSERGAFSAKYQYYQTLHEKALIGGYLSRLPDGAMVRYRRDVVVRTLLRLSEGRDL